MNELISSVKKGFFLSTNHFINKYKLDDLYETLCTIALDGNPSGYAFINYLIQQQDCLEYRWKAQELCYTFYLYMPYAIISEFSYLEYLEAKEPNNIEILELRTYFLEYRQTWIIPVYTKAEEYQLVQRVLALDPKSEVGLYLKNKVAEYANEPFTEVGEGLEGIAKTKEFIQKGRFSKALANLHTHSREEIFDVLRDFATQGFLFAYSFVWAWIREDETADLHSLAAEFFLDQYVPTLIRITFPGREGIAFFHSSHAAELEPDNVELQEKLLGLYELTPESFDPVETKALAERVLAQKPESTEAARVLNLITA